MIEELDLEKRELAYNKSFRPIIIDAEINTLGDILYHLFKNQSDKTFFKNGKIQCDDSRYRTLKDFYKCARTYIPEITLKECNEVLKSAKLYQFACGVVRQLTYTPWYPYQSTAALNNALYKHEKSQVNQILDENGSNKTVTRIYKRNSDQVRQNFILHRG